MSNLKSAVTGLHRKLLEKDRPVNLSFEDYLKKLQEQPKLYLRSIFQVFHDMIKTLLGEGYDEYPDDPESIHFLKYDTHRLFVQGSNKPFFADRLFANRLVTVVDWMRRSTHQNKIYVFKGPPGSGKSTFLNNVLLKFEEYTNTEAGRCYELVWRIDRNLFASAAAGESFSFLEKLYRLIEDDSPKRQRALNSLRNSLLKEDRTHVEIPCPSHDIPILIVPEQYRKEFLRVMFQGSGFQENVFSDKEYEWVFQHNPCTICTSLYQMLLHRVKDPEKVSDMIYARPYVFNRRVGEGISIFNPGDMYMRKNIQSDEILQRQINAVLQSSKAVKYIFSQYAKTNNGIYALMDIKSNNKDRLIELHNIISEGVHKVGDIEESVNSILFAVMNPEDKKEVDEFKSFSDRIEYITIPYVMDLNTEVEIYRNIFGSKIEDSFLPRVLHNFARVIISTRLKHKSPALLQWIEDPEKYQLYCDPGLQLLKMEIYTGFIPRWLSEEDRKRLTAGLRRKIIAESESEGEQGISGRDSIKIFNHFISTYAKEDKLISMSLLYSYFTKRRKDLAKYISNDFLDSLIRMYDFTILQEVKESLYYYNRTRISKDIQNYLFAINFELGSKQTCMYTGEKIEVTEEFLKSMEERLLGLEATDAQRLAFREDLQKEYTTITLTQEMMVENRPIARTKIYEKLHEKYLFNIKEKALDPFLKNVNFRRAIKDYGTKDFNSYDKRVKQDVRYLIRNLKTKYRYTEQGAVEMCMYVIDNGLAKKFTETKN